MDSLDKIRKRQRSNKDSETHKNIRKDNGDSELRLSSGAKNYSTSKKSHDSKKSKKRKKRKVIGTAIKIGVLLILGFIIFSGVWIARNIDFSFGDNLSSMNLNLSSTVYYMDEDGNPKKYEQFVAAENRIWVSIDKIPENLKNAFVAIEDQRFYKHHGVDIKRTVGAVVNYVLKGDSSYGGSTITQQLVKNITNDKERTKARKIREILRALVLESKVSKEQILEMYLNTIYLSQGANGVEAAANTYFSKNVSELTLGECACIAGITQYPATYDPILHPKNNEKKRKIVLKEMLDQGYISKSEYNDAVNQELEFIQGEEKTERIQSYFLDNLFEVLLDDLIKEGYSEQFAINMIYNGGLKVYATVDPKIQNIMEKEYENDSSFPNLGGSSKPQSAMVISDPKTGEIKGIVGGRGEKTANRVLNRATQTTRQPGSSIKPISVYAPALDMGIITPGTSVEDSPLEIGDWKPKNSDGKFHGYVSVRSALTHSYNIPAIRILEELTVDTSYKYLKNKLHIDTLVSGVTQNGKVYSDKNLSSLALGGLTNGVTVMEMNMAYAALANGGTYIEPSVYTKVYDADGRLLLEKKPETNKAFSEETAYLTSLILKDVVKSGTGYGAHIPNMDTCGKTGTTDDTKDRWFIGYTPYYVGAVWFGYDEQKTIPSSGTNPALAVWRDVMTEIHKPLASREFKQPSGVEKMTVCSNTGRRPTSNCRRVTEYVNTEYASLICSGKHSHIGTESKSTYYNKHTDTNSNNKDNDNKNSEDKLNSDSGQGTNSNDEEEEKNQSEPSEGSTEGSGVSNNTPQTPILPPVIP